MMSKKGYTMNKTNYPRYLISLFAITLLSACASSPDSYQDADLEETISAQSTRIAHLSTEVAQQEQTNGSQWDAISYLSTQMPFALELITPIPPGTTLKPTPYSPPDQETKAQALLVMQMDRKKHVWTPVNKSLCLANKIDYFHCVYANGL